MLTHGDLQFPTQPHPENEPVHDGWCILGYNSYPQGGEFYRVPTYAVTCKCGTGRAGTLYQTLYIDQDGCFRGQTDKVEVPIDFLEYVCDRIARYALRQKLFDDTEERWRAKLQGTGSARNPSP